MWRYGILGAVELRDGGRRRPVRGPTQVSLLALLLVQRNQAVPADRAIEALWPGGAAESGRERLRGAVARRRRALGAGDSPLRTVAGGYLLAVAAGELDAELFETRLTDGR